MERFLSALGVTGNLIHEYCSRNKGRDEYNQYLEKYGKQRGIAEYHLLRGKTLDGRIRAIAEMCSYIPYSDIELKHIKENVEGFVEPQWSMAVLNKYKKETGETLKYMMDIKWEREGRNK